MNPFNIGDRVRIGRLERLRRNKPEEYSWLPREGKVVAVAHSLATEKPLYTIALSDRIRLTIPADELALIEGTA